MKKRLYRFFVGGRRFHDEFRKQIRLLIIFALGFTIAFTWRQTIFDMSKTFVQFLTNVTDSSSLSILTSTFITIISIILIYLTSHFLKDKY